MFEAQAIAIEMENIVSNRPMTHDLFKAFATSFDIEIQQVIINNLKEGVFYAKLVCVKGDQYVELDARPSDAIAIGIRFSVPIYAEDRILAEAGIEFSEMEETTESVSSSDLQTEPARTETSSSQVTDLSVEDLEQKMSEAIANEDYESAARFRDEINRRKDN